MVQRQATDTAKVLDRKRIILQEASKAFRDKGFHATGMRDIAKRMGVTVGSLYYYFESKDDLLAWCQDTALSCLLEEAGRIAGLDLGADAKLYLLVTAHVVALNDTIPGSLAHLEVAERLGADRGLEDKRRAYERIMREVVQAGLDDGVFADADAKVSTLAILGAVNWTVRWYRPDGEVSALGIGEQFARQLVGGLLAPGRELEAPDPAAWNVGVADVYHEDEE